MPQEKTAAFTGKLADPEFRRERARKGGRTTRNNLTPEQRSASAARARAAQTSLDTAIKRIVDRAPELTAEQVAKLRTILAPAGR